MRETVFKWAFLRGADLSAAELSDADFGGADLNSAKLKGVQADGASFAGTDLHGADLRNGRFARADFTGANLAGANIKGADLGRSVLTGVSDITCAYPRLYKIIHSDSRMKKEKTALRLLAEEGWFFNPEIPVSILHEIEPRIRENPDKVWNWFDDFFRNHLDSIERRLAKSYPKRARFFGGAFSAHRQGEYSLSIPVFLSQADGVFSEIFPKKSLFMSGKRESAISTHASQTGEGWIGVFMYPLSIMLPLWMPESRRGEFFSGLNRHQVLHGESVDYDTERNSLKSISLLGYLHWISMLLDNNIGLE